MKIGAFILCIGLLVHTVFAVPAPEVRSNSNSHSETVDNDNKNDDDNNNNNNQQEENFIVYPPNQTRTTKSPSPFFFWFDKPITNPLDAANFWFSCMKKIERDADPNNLVKNRLDWPLTTIERQVNV